MSARGAVAALLLLCCGPPQTHLAAPPAELGLPPFFTKYVMAAGVPIVAGPWVDDAALLEAQRLIVAVEHEGDHPRTSLAGYRVELFAERDGLASLPGPRLSSGDASQICGLTEFDEKRLSVNAESLLCRSTDCAVGSTFLHEVGHVLKNSDANADLRGTIERAWADATQRGLWAHSYGRRNADEYWAEGTQIWFDAKPVDLGDHIHTRDELEAYDPTLGTLLARVLGRGTWRYRCPGGR